MFHRLAALAMALPFASAAAGMVDVKISLQPAYHAIPIWAAKEFGWFEDLGLNVILSLYASGAPQVKDAAENKAWDFGIAGSVPNVIAGQQGFLTVGINNDESKTTEVVGAPGVEDWPPAVLHPGIFAGTPKSTGELLLRKCLVQAGLKNITEGDIMWGQQLDVIKELEKEDTDLQYACLWAPNTYTYRSDNPKAKVFCSGRTIDFPIYGGLLVREDWAESNNDLVAKVLAAYLRGVTFMQNAEDLDDVIRISKEYHLWSGTTLSEAALEEDLILRPLFNLDEQLDHMSRNFANDYTSDADRHYIELEEFLFEHGVITNKFQPKEYVTTKYMKLVSEDPELRAFSYYGAADFETSSSTMSTSGDDDNNAGTIAGIVIGIVGAVCLIIALFVVKKKRTVSDGIKEQSPEINYT